LGKVRVDFVWLAEYSEEEWRIQEVRVQMLQSFVEVMLFVLMVYDLVYLVNELEEYDGDELYEMGSVSLVN